MDYITYLPLVEGSDPNWTQMQLKLYLYKVKVLYHEIPEDHDYEVSDNINTVFLYLRRKHSASRSGTFVLTKVLAL